MKTCIVNGKVILKDRIEKLNVFYNNEIITEISNRIPDVESIIDAKGLYVSPGFVDIHIHGKNGSDTMYDTFDDLNNISVSQASVGVTSFLPTTMTMSIEDTNKAIDNIALNMDKVTGGKILGVHMEGPFFCEYYKGAQPSEYMIEPSVENFEKLTNGHTDIIKKMSLAPELENTDDLIKYLVNNNISVSIGHSQSSYKIAKHAFDLGVNSTTHTYNAMTPLTHREPGVVGAVMNDDRVFAELILDGVHVSYPAVEILINAKSYDKVVLVTDSIEAALLPDGEYKLGGQPVFVEGSCARLKNGALAGSVLNMNESIKIAYKELKIPLFEAVKMASLNAAISINVFDLGEIAVDKKSDIIFFDEDIVIKKVIINGNEVI